MKVSIIIPAFNEEKYIEKTIFAVKSQNYFDIEIIVVDNGCTDKTVAISQAFGARVLKEKKKGISHARNKGARMAKGDVLCFVDADGMLSEAWSASARKSLKKSNISVVVGINIFTHEKVNKFLLYNGYTIFGYSGLILFKSILGNLYLSGNNMAIKRRVFWLMKGFDPVVGEDYWLSRKFWKLRAKKGSFDPRMVIWYSSRGFDSAGYYKTLSLWIKSGLTKIPQEKYNYKNKNL